MTMTSYFTQHGTTDNSTSSVIDSRGFHTFCSCVSGIRISYKSLVMLISVSSSKKSIFLYVNEKRPWHLFLGAGITLRGSRPTDHVRDLNDWDKIIFSADNRDEYASSSWKAEESVVHFKAGQTNPFQATRCPCVVSKRADPSTSGAPCLRCSGSRGRRRTVCPPVQHQF